MTDCSLKIYFINLLCFELIRKDTLKQIYVILLLKNNYKSLKKIVSDYEV